VLTSREEQVWEHIQRSWTEEAQEPSRLAPSPTKPASRAEADLPVAIGVGVRLAIVLFIFGAAQAALAVAVATALGWTLWHHWPHLSRKGAFVTLPDDGNDTTARGPAS
jgi:hypothetical protein